MKRICFIGGGNMSRCIFDSIIALKDCMQNYRITISSPHLEKLSYFKDQGADITASNIEAALSADIIFLGVKPQVLTSVLEELSSSGIDFKDKLVVSMAAGFKVSSISRYINSNKLVRIMPNTPCKIAEGVNGIYFKEPLPSEDEKELLLLLDNMGLNIILSDEEQINAIGVVAGSAPAFLFRYMEAMVANSIRLGFDEKLARRITEQVVFGGAKLVKSSPDTEISALREAVTSKGGTTYEGLKVMTENGFDDIMSRAVDASLKRTKEFEDMF